MRRSKNKARDGYLRIMSLLRKKRREFIAPIVADIQAEMWKPSADDGRGLSALLRGAPEPGEIKANFYEITSPKVSDREFHRIWKRMRQRDQLFIARGGNA